MFEQRSLFQDLSDKRVSLRLSKGPKSGRRYLVYVLWDSSGYTSREEELIPDEWTDAQAIRHAIATYDILLEQHVTHVELHKLRTVLDNYHAGK